MLVCEGTAVAVADRELVRELNLSISPGRLLAILGPNGVGKSLTLHTLAGLRPPTSGTVTLDGHPLGELGRSEIARRLGMLLQRLEDRFPQTVFECALMGCQAKQGLLHWESAADRTLARTALQRLDLDHLESRLAMTLSGGERRRLGIATLLVQDPEIMLLDEPTGYLDPRHQLQVLGLARELAAQGKAVVASLHDPALASQFADDVLLLHGDGRWNHGPVGSLLTADYLERLYDTPFHLWNREQQSVLLPV